MADDTQRFAPSPLTTDFLRQIADFPRQGDAATYAYASSVILPLTGWPPEEFLGLLEKDLSQRHNQRILERAHQARATGAFSAFSFSLTAKDGGLVHFQATPRPVATESGEAAAIAVLTPLPAHPSAPLDTKDDLFRFLEVFPAYVLLIDRDYSVRFANRSARQLFGSESGKKCYQLLHGRNEPCISCPPFGLLTDKAIKVHEWVSTRANTAFRSHSYPFEDRDGATLVLQVGINITAGVRARHALDLSEQRYRSIADNLTMGLALVDPKGELITLNPKMEEWFGEKAVKGASLEALLQYRCCGEAQNGADCVLRTVLREKKTAEKEFRLPRQEEERYFRLVACPILTRSQQVRAIVIMLEDITDRRHMASRLQQIQRLEALGSLAGGIAHEINQPLSALHLYASGMQMLMEHRTATPEQVLERLSLILAQAEKIRQIISHMRALVMQEENPPLSPVRVADVVNDALGLVGAQLLDHGIKISLNIPDTTPPVSANAVQLEQVVINLLVNAMHALDSLSGEPQGGKKILMTAARNEENQLVLRVSDNGPGVGALHSRIFDPFFTTKSPNLGMGLGLSIVHAFVSSWGGSVEAANNPDGPGAVFSVTLPLAGDDNLS
ncbi:Sensory box histidine kinase [uncultured delta proteobacterium]|uniref:histidine kinase n=1 Tax=uncultured delta proteobacterium TaxID=34034 RepID=A0A212K0H7_9DELT|nr:Sensory box histidine kinase [uncultured delta proteobacterium]